MKIPTHSLAKTLLLCLMAQSILTGQIPTAPLYNDTVPPGMNDDDQPAPLGIIYDEVAPGKPEKDPVTLLLPLGHHSQITSLNVRSNGELISTDNSNTVHFWDLESMTWLRSQKNDFPLYYDRINDGGFTLANSVDASRNEFGVPTNACLGKAQTICKNGEFYHSGQSRFFSRGLSVDGKYGIDSNLLIPSCPEFGDTILLGFSADGFTGDGNYLRGRGGDTLFRWPYLPFRGFRHPITGAQVGETSPQYSERLSKIKIVSVLPGSEGFTLTIQRDADYNPFNPSGGRYVIGRAYDENSWEYLYKVWDSWENKLLVAPELPAGTEVTEISPDGRYLLLYRNDYEARKTYRSRYNIETRSIDLSFDPPDISTEYYALPNSVFAKNGTVVCSPSKTGAIHVFSTETGKLLTVLQPKVRRANHLALNEDETSLLIGLAQDGENRQLLKWQWNYSNRLTTERLEPADYDNQFETNELERFVYYEYRKRPQENAFLFKDTSYVKITSVNGDYDFFCMFEIKRYHRGNLVFKRLTSHSDDSGAIGTNQRMSAYALLDSTQIAAGTQGGGILIFDGKGEYQYTLAGHADVVERLVFFQGGEKLASTSKDGSIRIWDMENHKELAKLFILNDKDWVVLNDDLLFDASPGAMNELKFLIDHAGGTYGAISELIELSQMKARFYEPGLLQKLLGYSDQPVRSVEGLADIPLYPEVSLSIKNDRLYVELGERDGGIGRVSLFVNGKELKEDIRGMKVAARDTISPSDQWLTWGEETSPFMEVDLTLPEFQKFFIYDNTLTVRAYNEAGSLYSRDVAINYQRTDRPKLVARGSGSAEDRSAMKDLARTASLYVVSVGTSRYSTRGIKLKYPDLDAQVMARSLRSVGNELFGTQGTVDVHCLTTNNKDSKAVKDLKKDGIQWAYADKKTIQDVFTAIAKKAKVQDVVVVYLSGHGKTVKLAGKDMFHYLTYETTSLDENDETILKNVAISSAELTNWTKRIAAYKQVFMVDACNAGQLISDLNGSRSLNSSQIRALERMSDRGGNYLISGSAANKVSYEASNYGQGLLTYALLKGMKAESLTETDSTDHYVGVTELFEYAKEEVGRLAEKNGGVQEPQVSYPLEAGTFALGIHNDNVEIPLGAVKPIVVRARLQSETFYSDTLGLEIKLNERCDKETDRGKDAVFIFLDIDRLPNSYQLRARYRLQPNGEVGVKGVLYKKGAPDIPIVVDPKPQDKIVEAVFKAIQESFVPKD